MKISVIIPAYNAEDFLEDTLTSVLAQTFDDFEVIVINDGSTDTTWDIIERYQGMYPEIIRAFSQENQGQSATRNHALKYVKGDYIAFVDADDLLEPEYLQKLYQACVEEQAEVAICGYKKFDTQTNEIVYTRLPGEWTVDFQHGLSHVFQYSPWAQLYSTEFIKKHHIIFSVGEQLEDGPYGVMTHILANKVAVVDWYGYRYRVYSGSTMGNVRKKQSKPKVPYKGIRAATLTVREFKKDAYTDEVLEYCMIKILAGLTTNMYKSVDKETRKEICQYCYKYINRYFPNVQKNPYIKMNALPKLPLSHRGAVRLFVLAYRTHTLYPFSLAVSKALTWRQA